MIKKSSVFFVIICLLAGAGPLSASSIKPFDLSARAASMSGAFLAKADDASAMYYNPAGIAFHKGVRVKANLYFNHLTTTARVSGVGPVHTSNPYQFNGSFFLTWGITDWLGIGVAGFNNYSAETEWITHWPGNLLSISSKLNSYTFRPAIAVQPVKGFALSIGLDFVSLHSLWSHGKQFPQTAYSQLDDKTVTSDLDTTGRGSGLVAGFLFKPLPFFQVGATYRQKISISQEGTNRFHLIEAFEWTYIPTPFGEIRINNFLQDFYKFQSVTSSLTLPEEISFGILLRPFSRLELLFEYAKTKGIGNGDWEFNSINSEENLNPEFTQKYGDFYGISPDYGNQKVNMTIKDSTSLRFGAEFDLNKVFSVRAGYSTHKNGVTVETLNPVIPDLEHSKLSFGLGYEGALFSLWSNEKISELSVDFFVQFIMAKEQTSAYPGYLFTYDADRWVFGFGVGLNL